MFMTSWLPRSAWTRPPALRASPSRRIRRSSTLRVSFPRSSRSPVWTRWAFPPAHLSFASTMPAKRRMVTRLS